MAKTIFAGTVEKTGRLKPAKTPVFVFHFINKFQHHILLTVASYLALFRSDSNSIVNLHCFNAFWV